MHLESTDCVLLVHGDGGRPSRRFLKQRVSPHLQRQHDSAYPDASEIICETGRLAFCTDSFIVSPLFFPGGDIGMLSVHGTSNDLAVAGARPKWMSLSMILEEGLPLNVVDRVLKSAAQAAKDVGITIVTGDTKVAPKGTIDQMFLTTSGIGELMEPVPPGPKSIRVGDVLLVSGPIGRHGLSILCAREGITFDPPPSSDVGDLTPAVESLLKKGIAVRSMRDATRGGVAAVLHEWAEACQRLCRSERGYPDGCRGTKHLRTVGSRLPFLACEGVMVVAVDKEQSALALDALCATCIGKQAAVIGQVEEGGLVPVIREGVLGIKHPLEEPIMPSMPRIC